ncbi:MAG: Na+/H+ antiporter NhaA [Aestuariibacter sp.]
MSSAIKTFFHHEAAPGVLLVAAAFLAMILANSPLENIYHAFLNLPVVMQFGTFEIAKPLTLWINDGLMAVFFFLVGLEIKRELLAGHLSQPSQVVLPAIAAIAGIIFPALFYLWFTNGDDIAANGWAIPAATDIAFALGLFILFGRSLPITLKLFLLSVAIFDDIGAIVIIALFYSQDLSAFSLIVAATGLAALLVVNRLQVRFQAVYIMIGIVVWAAVLKSGVHATLAGFALAWFIPLKLRNSNGKRMLPHMEHALHPWVAFFVLPVFAFANAGVNILNVSMETLFNPITLGIVAGLFLGKQIGILGSCWLAVKTGIARLPKGANWLQMYGVCLLCGVGFTMSLFIGSLAFEGMAASYQLSVKLGVLLGSLLSAVVGALVLIKAKPVDQKSTVNKQEANYA